MLDIFCAFLGFSAGTIVSAMVMSLKFKRQVLLPAPPTPSRSQHRWYVTGADHPDIACGHLYVVHLKRRDKDNYMVIGSVDVLVEGYEEKLQKLIAKAEDICRSLNVVEEDITPSRDALRT